MSKRFLHRFWGGGVRQVGFSIALALTVNLSIHSLSKTERTGLW